jgi:hypothetical protein
MHRLQILKGIPNPRLLIHRGFQRFRNPRSQLTVALENLGAFSIRRIRDCIKTGLWVTLFTQLKSDFRLSVEVAKIIKPLLNESPLLSQKALMFS